MSSQMQWLKNHWVKILMIMVGAIILIAVIKAVTNLLNGNGPLIKSVSKVIGTVALLAQQVSQPCGSQADCSKLNEEEICNKGSGCGWGRSKQAEKEDSCKNTTGENPHGTNIFNGQCLIGIGIIGYVFQMLFAAIGTVFGLYTSKSEAVNAVAQVEGRSRINVAGDVIKKVIEKVEQSKTENKKLKDLLENNPKMEEQFIEFITHAEVVKKLESSLTNKKGSVTKEEIETYNKEYKKASKAREKISENQNDEWREEVENTPEAELGKQATFGE